MYIDLPENTNFKGFFIISKDEREEELLPSLFAYTENENESDLYVEKD